MRFIQTVGMPISRYL